MNKEFAVCFTKMEKQNFLKAMEVMEKMLLLKNGELKKVNQEEMFKMA